jgi:octaprenyl-diphosphate synthase
MIEGEVLQRQWLGRLDLAEETYLRIIQLKTASLISGSCRSGALLGGADDAEALALARFGELVGTAFQIIDDTLDYTADPDRFGKKIGGDLLQGVVTLPLIYLAGIPAAAGDMGDLAEALSAGTVDDGSVSRIVALMKEHDCGRRAMSRAAEYAVRSKEELGAFSSSPVYPALVAAADFIIERSH